MDDRVRFRQWSPPTRIGGRATPGLVKADPTFRTASSGGPQMKPSTMPSTSLGGAAPAVKPTTLSLASSGGAAPPVKPSTVQGSSAGTGGPQLPSTSQTPPAAPAGGGGTKDAGVGKPKAGGGVNVLGMYHYGQSLGMTAASPEGGATAFGQHAGRVVGGVHGLLNRKTPAHYEAARGQREGQLQRQEQTRRMAGEGGGVVTQSSMARSLNLGLPVRGGIRRFNNG